MSDPHSAQFLTDYRDFYWNDDFLALIAKRLHLDDVKRVVDVGSGLGHWTRAVKRMLPNATITGVEREPKWVKEARGVDGVDYVEGDALSLPFPDASVDMVTCQTVLIHIQDPRVALREMHRILKPGGVLLCAEPNNAGSTLTAFVTPALDNLEDILSSLRLELTCQRGKAALGDGFNSVGEVLVSMLDDSWVEPRVWNCDRAYAMRAPYPDDAKAIMAQERAWHDEGSLLWSEAESRRHFVAGGGDETKFSELWEALRRVQKRRFADFDKGAYGAANGGLFYLVAARRRST
jgi:SAM-dependent methyltransferase